MKDENSGGKRGKEKEHPMECSRPVMTSIFRLHIIACPSAFMVPETGIED